MQFIEFVEETLIPLKTLPPALRRGGLKLFIEKYSTPTDLASSDMTHMIKCMRTLEPDP